MALNLTQYPHLPIGTALDHPQVALMAAEVQKLHDLERTDFETRPDRDDLVRELVSFQKEHRCFAILEDADLMGELEAAYDLEPNYAACRLLTRAFLAGSRVAGIEEALGDVLGYSTLTEFCADHPMEKDNPLAWCDARTRDQLDNLGSFVDAGVPRLMRERPDLCTSFAEELDKLFRRVFETELDDAVTIFYRRRGGVTFEMLELMEAFGYTPRVKLFVYGSLCAGMQNAHLLDGCAWKGRGMVEGYSLYDAEPFPAAVNMLARRGFDDNRLDDNPVRLHTLPLGPLEQVMGELYEVTVSDLRRINEALGATDPDKGATGRYMLDFADVALFRGDPYCHREITSAFVYAACGEFEESLDAFDRIPLQLQPYRRYASLRDSHVWYVGAGEDADPRVVEKTLATCGDAELPLFDFGFELQHRDTVEESGDEAEETAAEKEPGDAAGAGKAGEKARKAHAFLVSRPGAVALAAAHGVKVDVDDLPTADEIRRRCEGDGDGDGATEDVCDQRRDAGDADSGAALGDACEDGSDSGRVYCFGRACGIPMLAFATVA